MVGFHRLKAWEQAKVQMVRSHKLKPVQEVAEEAKVALNM